MALERRNGRVYYYQSRRVGDQVRREYRGCGYVAVLMDRLDGLQWEKTKYSRWCRTDRLVRWRRRLRRIRKALKRARGLTAAALRAAGWHQHKREWRKKRGQLMTTNVATLVETWLPSELRQRAGALDAETAASARKGNPSAAPAVREYLDNPAAVALWGNAGRSVLEQWVKMYANGDLLKEEAVLRQVQVLRTGLTGPNPLALERVLAERVVLAWVSLSVAELWYARLFETVVVDVKVRAAAVLDVIRKQVSHAHRQLMAACNTLAKVRRAKLPEVLALVNVNPRRGSEEPNPGEPGASAVPLSDA